MNILDPIIKVSDALKKVGGSQAELGRVLGIGRASVNEWVRESRKHLPPLQAHRFVDIYGYDLDQRSHDDEQNSNAA